MVSVVFAAYTSDSVHRPSSSAHSMCWPIAFRKLKHTCSPPKRKMTFSNLGFAHTISLPLLYKGWSAVMMVCFWPVRFEMSTKRLITVVSVSLSSAGACGMGSIPAVVTGGSTILVASLRARHVGTDRLCASSWIRDKTHAKSLAHVFFLSTPLLLTSGYNYSIHWCVNSIISTL